jgi:hypothetical protein
MKVRLSTARVKEKAPRTTDNCKVKAVTAANQRVVASRQGTPKSIETSHNWLMEENYL